MKQYKSVQIQSIGWADMVITEDARDPNDYNLGPDDPYNTDDDVVEDLFDQWARQHDGSFITPSEDMQLSFELGAQLAMQGKYNGEQSTITVPSNESRQFLAARHAALRDFGLTVKKHGEPIFMGELVDAFDAGYKAISSSAKQ